MTYYHLRITLLTKEEAGPVAVSFTEKWKHYLTKAIFGYENVEDKNHHIHGHLVYKENITVQELDKVRYYIKSRYPAKYNHQPLKKDPRHNELYVTKDTNIVHKYNYTDEEVKSIEEDNEAIEEDKKKDPKLKLIEIIKQKHGNILKLSMNRLLEEIKDVYILTWDKMPPPQCKAYTEYIAVKEVAEYMKAPRLKKDPLGDLPDEVILPPLAKSYNDHCRAQYPHDTSNYDNEEWD